ncbi:MAG: hypothetical protein ACRCT1_04925 [Microcoleaceae cyanobacterium]
MICERTVSERNPVSLFPVMSSSIASIVYRLLSIVDYSISLPKAQS